MNHYAGIDVSLEAFGVCVVDAEGAKAEQTSYSYLSAPIGLARATRIA